MNKLFSQYLNESKKSWKFCIKTVHDLTDEQCDRIEKHLGKYDSKGLGAAKKTILQSAPRDFPNHKGYEVFTHMILKLISLLAVGKYKTIFVTCLD